MTTTALRRQLAGFLVIGAVGTGAYLGVYLVLRLGIEAHLANVTARTLVAIPTTWVNGRRTFGSQASVSRIVIGAVAVLAVGTAISALPLAAEQTLVGPDDRTAEVLTLVAANLVATLARFLLLRNWLFRPASPQVVVTTQRRAAPTDPTVQPAGS